MKSTFDLVISTLLLMTYAFCSLYASALLQRVASRTGRPHFAATVISFHTLRKYAFAACKQADPDKQQARFLLRVARISLVTLIVFVICSLLFEPRPKKQQELFFITTNTQPNAKR